MQIIEFQSAEKNILPVPQNQSEPQLLQPAMEDLKFGRTVDGNTVLEAIRVKYGLKPSTQSR